jgi:hypothetical protein
MRRTDPFRQRAAVAVACLAVAACHSHGGDVYVAGTCTIDEPGGPPLGGVSAYVEHVTPTAGGGFGVGSLAVTVSCLTGGTAPDHVYLMLPNLRRGARPALGEYHVRNLNDSTLTTAELTDPRLAWARVQRGADHPVLYTADGGRVVITRADSTALEGAYQLAVSIADSAVSLPGARPEVSGPVATGPAGAPLVSRTALGGAFLAPWNEADWRGR